MLTLCIYEAWHNLKLKEIPDSGGIDGDHPFGLQQADDSVVDDVVAAVDHPGRTGWGAADLANAAQQRATRPDHDDPGADRSC